MKKAGANVLWTAVALAGAAAYAMLALARQEPVNSIYILVAALCSYAIGYRFYSKWIAAHVLMLDERRATPCEVHDDGKDFVKTNRWIVFGHHFAAISGPGPLVGPVLAAQFGYLPGTLWILIGVTLGGAVQDFVILFCSMRRDGKSLGQMVKEEMNTPAGVLAVLAILSIIIILLAVLALVVVKALAESPWGVFTVGSTIPIAILMGLNLRFWRPGRVLEASAFGVVALLLAVWGGKLVYESPDWGKFFGLHDLTLAWVIIGYGLAASILPVWLLLAPRDYLSTFMKLGTIGALALGICLVLPKLEMPAISQFVDGSGPVVAGKIFPFCFITIACGAISGFHTLIASGTTPKLITRESYARPIGYGAMCLESLVAVMALIAACTLEPGVYFSMNLKGDPAATAATISGLGFPVTVPQMEQLAQQLGEKTLFGRTGGAATLAVGMAHVFSKAVSGRWLDLWYHFAIMFEALFILTTIDAGTRVGRYLLQDVLGQFWEPLRHTRSLAGNLAASGLMVGAWGFFLIQGVRDPLGGINSLWPLFGIANQMLAAIALALATTIILKMQLRANKSSGRSTLNPQPSTRSLALCLITLVPLVWLLAATMTAGVQKVWASNPRIGFLAHAHELAEKTPALGQAVRTARDSQNADGVVQAQQALRTNRVNRFNDLLDAAVASIFLILVGGIVVLSVREWIRLLRRDRPAILHETEPVWLPDYAVAEGKSAHVAGMLALSIGLAKELSGEASLERAQGAANSVCLAGQCEASQNRRAPGLTKGQLYSELAEQRFQGVHRCC